MKKLLFLFMFPLYMYAVILNQETIDDFIKKENIIINYIENYILENGTKPNKATLITYFKLPTDLFTNIYNQNNAIDFEFNGNTIVLKNVISTNLTEISDVNLAYYKNSQFHKNSYFGASFLEKNILMSAKVVSTLNFVATLVPNSVVSTTEPTTPTLKYWYKPSGDGTFSMYIKNSDGVFVSNNYKNNYQTYYVNKVDFSVAASCNHNDITFVNDSNLIEEYVCYQGKWLSKHNVETSTPTNDVLNGDSTLNEIVCNGDGKAVDSIAKNVSVFPFSNTKKEFVKKAKASGYDDYWLSTDGKDLVAKNALNMLYYQSSTVENVYMCYKNKVIMAKKMKVNNVDKFVYLTNSYKDLYQLTLNTPEWIGNNSFLTWDLVSSTRNDSYKQFFTLSPTTSTGIVSDNIFSSTFSFNGVDNSVINESAIIANNKAKFTTPLANKMYLTIESDCNNQCFGTGIKNSNVYSGTMIDGLYSWFYDDDNLQWVDAIVTTNINDLYSDTQKAYALYLDYTGFKKLMYKKEDNNGNICYQSQDGIWYTKNLQPIPTMYIKDNKPNLPQSRTCSDVVFDSNNLMVLNTRSEIAKYTSADVNYQVISLGVISTKKGIDANDYWENSTELFTYQTRSNFPVITNNSKKYLTLKIGGINTDTLDPNKIYRFSENGLKYPIDTNFYMWLYLESAKSVKNLADADCFNTNYTSDVCNLKYNGKKFNFNNNQCEVPLDNTFCPVVDGKQTLYDSNNGTCYLNVDNTYCTVGYTYSSMIKLCYKVVCPTDLTYNTSSSRCEKIYQCPSGSYDPTVTFSGETMSGVCKVTYGPGQVQYQKVDCYPYTRFNNVCYQNTSLPNIYTGTVLGDISVLNPTNPSGMTFDSTTDRFTINVNALSNTNLTNGDIPTLNLTSMNDITLFLDNVNNVIAYTPSSLVCSKSKMPSGLLLNTPTYNNSDGNCYSTIAEECSLNGYSTIQSKDW